MGRMKDDTMEPADPPCGDCAYPLDADGTCDNPDGCVSQVDADERRNAKKAKLFVVDVYARQTDSDFNRFCIRSTSSLNACSAVRSLAKGHARVEVERAPKAAKTFMSSIPDGVAVLIGDGDVYFMQN